MKSILKLELELIWIVVVDDCLDLPSLTKIQGGFSWLHSFMGRVILESMVLFDFTMIRYSKSHSRKHLLWRRFIYLYC